MGAAALLHVASAYQLCGESSWATVNKDDGTRLLSVSPTEIFNSIRTLHRAESALSHDGSSVQLSWWPSMRQLSRVVVSGSQPAEV